MDPTIVLDQTSYAKKADSIPSMLTHTVTTAGETHESRMCVEDMQWTVTQTGPQHAAALSEMQSKMSQSTLRLIKEKHSLVSDVKLSDTHLTIHPFSRQSQWNDFAVVGYTDAAQGDRADGRSIGGYVLTTAPDTQFIQGHISHKVSWVGRRPSSSVRRRVYYVPRSSKLADADDEFLASRLLWSDINGYQATKQNVTDAVKATPGIIVLDAKGVYAVLPHKQFDSIRLYRKT